MNDYWSAASAIVPSDSIAIPATAGVYVGVSGNVKVDMALAGAGPVTFLNVPVGFHRLSVKKVYATGTTATGLFALR